MLKKLLGYGIIFGMGLLLLTVFFLTFGKSMLIALAFSAIAIAGAAAFGYLFYKVLLFAKKLIDG